MKEEYESEKELQNVILEFLSDLSDVAMVRQNNAGGFTGYRQNKIGNPKGQPDIDGLLKDGRPFFLEVKKKPQKISPEQKEFLERVRNAGAIGELVYSLSEVIQIFQREGYLHR